MKRKKSEVDVTKKVLAEETEGVIDLDQVDLSPDTLLAKAAANRPSDEAVGTPAQAQPRPKRKYTRRASKKVETGVKVTPTFVDVDGIRSARIQAFIDYVDDNRTFDSAVRYDADLKSLLKVANQIILDRLAQGHATAVEKINELANNVEEGGYYRDDTKNRSRADVDL